MLYILVAWGKLTCSTHSGPNRPFCNAVPYNKTTLDSGWMFQARSSVLLYVVSKTCTGIFYTDTAGICEGTQFVNEAGLSGNQTNTIHYAGHITGFKDIGCMTDGVGHTRALLHYYASDNAMTAEFCFESCKTSGYAFFEVEAAHCFCGDDTYDRYGRKDGCHMPCGGNQTQMCGGYYAISVFGYTYGC